MIPIFDPVSFRQNPMITEFDGLDEYIAKFSNEQLIVQYRLSASNWGSIPLNLMFVKVTSACDEEYARDCALARKRYKNDDELLQKTLNDLEIKKDENVQLTMQLAGEYVIGHTLALLNLNVVGKGVTSVHKGTEGVTFGKSSDWQSYCESTAFGRELLANIMGDNKAEYFDAPDILNPTNYNVW